MSCTRVVDAQKMSNFEDKSLDFQTLHSPSSPEFLGMEIFEDLYSASIIFDQPLSFPETPIFDPKPTQKDFFDCFSSSDSLDTVAVINDLRLSSIHCDGGSQPTPFQTTDHFCGPPCRHTADNGFLGAALADFPDVEFIDLVEFQCSPEKQFEIDPESKPKRRRTSSSSDVRYNPLVHCGVYDDANQAPCIGTLSCCKRGHNIAMKKLVQRPRDFHELKKLQKATMPTQTKKDPYKGRSSRTSKRRSFKRMVLDEDYYY